MRQERRRNRLSRWSGPSLALASRTGWTLWMGQLVDLSVHVIVQGIARGHEEENHDGRRSDGPVIRNGGSRGYQHAHQEADDTHKAVAQSEQLDYPVHGAGLGLG